MKFKTEEIGICGRCTHYLNENPEPASAAQARIAERLSRGIQRRAHTDLDSDEEWKRRRAAERLDDIDSAVDDALPGWLNTLLADPANRSRDFKMIRAFRRGLLRMNGPSQWSYPANWKQVANDVRRRDRKCMMCGDQNARLDVHHIVYLSNYGTNQKSNLVSLCRSCHEQEHGRQFDEAEAEDPEQASPLRPQRNPPSFALLDLPPPAPPPPPRPELAPFRASTDLSKEAGTLVECAHCGASQRLETSVEWGQYVRCRLCTVPFQVEVGASRVVPFFRRPPFPSKPKVEANLSGSDGTRVETDCPNCYAHLSALLERANDQKIRCPVCTTVFVHKPESKAAAGSISSQVPVSQPSATPFQITDEKVPTHPDTPNGALLKLVLIAMFIWLAIVIFRI
ncbi:HNH endonuclease [Hydrogenophaga sp.]|uniref:HNH endonuclease n=1 Tax=Hydrogenophaga sp. TaxID=1904254 RepID=UPI00261ECEC8|nr:HNH endonuclease [Hydrogenophaga sp.]